MKVINPEITTKPFPFHILLTILVIVFLAGSGLTAYFMSVKYTGPIINPPNSAQAQLQTSAPTPAPISTPSPVQNQKVLSQTTHGLVLVPLDKNGNNLSYGLGTYFIPPNGNFPQFDFPLYVSKCENG